MPSPIYQLVYELPLLLGNLTTAIFGRVKTGGELPRVHIYIDELGRFSLPIMAPLWVQGGRQYVKGCVKVQSPVELQMRLASSAC